VQARQPVSTQPADEDELYVCDHCGFDELTAGMDGCPKCNSKFDAIGNIVARPCPACGLITRLGGDVTTCEECKIAIDTETWIAIPEASKQPAQRRTRAQAAAAKAMPQSEDKLPWGRK
jgi:ribosomal protein L37AE/L43A